MTFLHPFAHKRSKTEFPTCTAPNRQGKTLARNTTFLGQIPWNHHHTHKAQTAKEHTQGKFVRALENPRQLSRQGEPRNTKEHQGAPWRVKFQNSVRRRPEFPTQGQANDQRRDFSLENSVFGEIVVSSLFFFSKQLQRQLPTKTTTTTSTTTTKASIALRCSRCGKSTPLPPR